MPEFQAVLGERQGQSPVRPGQGDLRASGFFPVLKIKFLFMPRFRNNIRNLSLFSGVCSVFLSFPKTIHFL